jgi:hypothetical protein
MAQPITQSGHHEWLVLGSQRDIIVMMRFLSFLLSVGVVGCTKILGGGFEVVDTVASVSSVGPGGGGTGGVGGSTSSTIGSTSAGGIGGAPGPAEWHVSAGKGDDKNSGKLEAPFRTIGKAVSMAKGGDTISIQPGLYDAAGGEKWQYQLASDVTVQGVGVGVVVSGPGVSAQTLFRLAGTGNVIRGFLVTNFGTGIEHQAGKHTVDSVKFDKVGGAAYSTAGELTLTKVDVTKSATAYEAVGSGQLKVIGGRVDDGGSCSAAVIRVRNAGRFDADGLSASNNVGVVVEGGDSSVVTLTKSTFTGNSTCAGSSTVLFKGSTQATLDGSTISKSGSVGLTKSYEAGTVTLHATTIDLSAAQGLVSGGGTLIIDKGSTIKNSKLTGVVLQGGKVTITSSTLAWNQAGVRVEGSTSLVMSGCAVFKNETGIWLYGSGGGGVVDLGSANNAGKNNFAGNADVALLVDWKGPKTIPAASNTWDSTAASPNGIYKPGTIISGPTTNKTGNVVIAVATVDVSL